jgi:hypothetical protein
MRAEMVQDPQRKQEEFKKAFAQMANLSAFRIVQQKPRSPDTVLLEIQVTVDGERMPMPLQRVGNEWKIDLDAQTEPE